MLGEKDAMATAAVRDLEVARRFYQDQLALKAEPDSEPSTAVYKAGQSKLLVYESEYAGSNRATTVTWPVDDVEREVKELKARGVAFEHYDMPGATLKGDVHVMGNMKAAWFKDPDGNIHAIVGA